MGTKRRLLITTGDPDGIGCEVTRKALDSLGPKTDIQFIYYVSANGPGQIKLKKFKTEIVSTLAQAECLPFQSRMAIGIRSAQSPAHWVEEAATACLAKRFAGMITGPLSKTSIYASGMKDIGHTEILSRISGVADLFMGFVGEKFCVTLATGHIPLRDATERLNKSLLAQALYAAEKLRKTLPIKRRQLPLAVVGFNPHAGEGGIIGSEEVWFEEVLRLARTRLGPIHGPLVPDAAFLPQNWPRYSVYVCPYHDQGLIPFKMIHGFAGGVHLTLGLPFVRTSVDHGTAKELFGKNKAQFGSMKDALRAAIQLSSSA